jgi:hypothetical protein
MGTNGSVQSDAFSRPGSFEAKKTGTLFVSSYKSDAESGPEKSENALYEPSTETVFIWCLAGFILIKLVSKVRNKSPKKRANN